MGGTADAKSPADCAGAAQQYSGTLRGIALCQVAVTLTYAVPAEHAMISRALYLPADRAADKERRELARVPDELMFAPSRNWPGGCSSRPMTAASARTSSSTTRCTAGLRRGRRLAVKAITDLVLRAMLRRTRTGSATKGARDYHWAMIDITPDDTPQEQDDGHGFLLPRQHRYTDTVSYFLCWSPDPLPLAKLISVAVPVEDLLTPVTFSASSSAFSEMHSNCGKPSSFL